MNHSATSKERREGIARRYGGPVKRGSPVGGMRERDNSVPSPYSGSHPDAPKGGRPPEVP